MASNELAIRFTENKYATKNEVAKELKTSLVDTFWHNILAYRSNFNHYLSLKSIDKNMFVYCGCQSMDSLMASLESKIQRINEEFSRVCADAQDRKYFVNQNIVKSCKRQYKEKEVEVTLS